MMHIANIPHVLRHGITHASSPNRNPNFVPIGDASLITARNGFRMPNGRRLGEYIPFYLGPRMPMLYVLQKGVNGVPATAPAEVVYCIGSVKRVMDHGLDFVFTNGHAVASLSEFYNPGSVTQMETLIDWKAVRAPYWKDENDLDLKRRKEAEFLIAGDVPASAVGGYGVYDTHAKTYLAGLGVPENSILVKPEWYF